MNRGLKIGNGPSLGGLGAFGIKAGGAGDVTPPTVSISSSAADPTIVNPVPLVFTLSESSADFAIGDITVSRTGTSLGNFAGSGINYTADLTITGSAITATVDINAGTFHDAAGNANLAATQYNLTTKLLLFDDFTDTRAAGAVNGTPAFPGPGGNRTVTDSGTNFSVGGGYLVVNTGTSGDKIAYPTQSRVTGRIFVMRGDNNGATEGGKSIGLSSTSSGANIVLGFNMQNGGNIRNAASPFNNYDAFANGIAAPGIGVYYYFVVTKATGAWLFLQGHRYPYPTLVYYNRVEATPTLYEGFNLTAGGSQRFAYAEIIDGYTPTALAADSFDRADGAVGGIWTGQTGTTGAIVSNTLSITPVGTVGILTTDAGNVDTFVSADLMRSTGTVGVITHFVNTDNYLRIIHDGTNLKIVQRLAGVESDLASAVVAYSSGTTISCENAGTSIRAWYNNTHVAASSPTMNAALVSGTVVGLWSSDVNNRLDNFDVYARGSANEHSTLGSFIKKGPLLISCDGDSFTIGGNPGTAYPTQLAALYTPAAEVNNYGVSGQLISSMVANSPAKLDGHPQYWGKVILCALGGSNDISNGVDATTVYNNIVTYCTARRANGYKVVVMTIFARGNLDAGKETVRTTVNTSIRNGWTGFADELCDLAADSRLSNASDTTYFHTDTVHLTTTGYGVVAALAKTEIDKLI